MATGFMGGGVSPYGPRPMADATQIPPGNALLAKEQAATARQAAGKNPSVTAGQILHSIINGLGVSPTALLHNAAVVGNSSLPVQAGVRPHGQIESAGVPLLGPGAAAHVGAMGLLPFKGLFGRAVEDVAAKEAPKVAPLVPDFASKIHPRALPRAQAVPTLGEAVTGSLSGARGLRAQQEALRSPERAARSQAFGKALQENPTAAGAAAAKGELAGKYPAVHFGGFESFSPEAHDAMVKFISDHPNLRPFESVRATGALAKIRAGTVPQKNEEKLLRTIFGPDVTNNLMTSVSKFRQLKALGYDVANIPRSVMASYDASGIMRQALMIGTGHPGIWAKNVPDYFKAMKSEDVYNAGMETLHQRPNAVNGVYEKMGVDLTELTPKGQSAAAREEAFRSPLAEKIPGVRMSGRGFTLFLDQARADLADHMIAKAARLGRDVNDPHLLQSIGDVVNSASGRGDLGTGVIGRSQEGLNLLLFSPRLIKSRIDFLNPVWYAKLDPLARHEAYRAMGGLVVLIATAVGIGKAAGAKVNLDPRSSDFAKIKFGNTRIDLAGGFQQYIRLLSELATQQVVSSTSGKVTNLGQAGPGKTSDFDVLFRFMRSKLAPLSSASVDVSQRQNSIGQPLTWSNSVLSRVTPLSGQDALSVGQDTTSRTGSVPAGVLAGIGAFGFSGIGGGVQNYQPKQPKQTGRTGYGPRTGGSGSDYGPRTGGSTSSYGPRP